MKRKYTATLALVVWVCVVAWVGSMVLVKPQVLVRHATDADVAMAAELQQQIQQSEMVRTALAEFEARPQPVLTGPIIAPAPAATAAAPAGDAATVAAVGVPVVSAIISTDASPRRAIVNGELVGTGARLADGSVVRWVGPGSVRVGDASGQTRTLLLRQTKAPAEEAVVHP